MRLNLEYKQSSQKQDAPLIVELNEEAFAVKEWKREVNAAAMNRAMFELSQSHTVSLMC
jgi:hypothetical protein